MHWKLLPQLVFMVMAPSVTLAQTQSPAEGGPAVAAPPSGSAYQSAFADYKPYTEPVMLPWREANDQVRDTGGMQGHDMATMNSQSADPHAGHDMSKMGAKPVAPAPAGAASASSADRAPTDHAAQGAKKAQAADPHAGHDRSKMTPAKTAAPGPAKPRAPSPARKTDTRNGAAKAEAADPHAGHDMSKMGTPPRQDSGDTDKADHGSHGAPPAAQAKNKKERQ
jgi:hypothetical protein